MSEWIPIFVYKQQQAWLHLWISSILWTGKKWIFYKQINHSKSVVSDRNSMNSRCGWNSILYWLHSITVATVGSVTSSIQNSNKSYPSSKYFWLLQSICYANEIELNWNRQKNRPSLFRVLFILLLWSGSLIYPLDSKMDMMLGARVCL